MNIVDLTGRVAIVTGSTAGLGTRFAHVLADAGATVVVTGRRSERIAEVVDAIGERGGKAHVPSWTPTSAARGSWRPGSPAG